MINFLIKYKEENSYILDKILNNKSLKNYKIFIGVNNNLKEVIQKYKKYKSIIEFQKFDTELNIKLELLKNIKGWVKILDKEIDNSIYLDFEQINKNEIFITDLDNKKLKIKKCYFENFNFIFHTDLLKDYLNNITELKPFDLINNLVKNNNNVKLLLLDTKSTISTTSINLINQNKLNELKTIDINKYNFILSCATEDYSNSISLLISSIQHTNKNIKIVIYCINWKDDLIKEFITNFPNVYFLYIHRKFNNKNDILKLKVELQYKFYETFNLNYLWIDSDSIVIKDLTPIFNSLINNHVCCRLRLHKDLVHFKFAVGVIGFSKNYNITLDFLRFYYDKCQINKGFENWYSDQISLYETYKYFGDKIKYFNLSEKYHSINGTINTIIYSRRNSNKYTPIDILEKFKIPYKLIKLNRIEYKN